MRSDLKSQFPSDIVHYVWRRISPLPTNTEIVHYVWTDDDIRTKLKPDSDAASGTRFEVSSNGPARSRVRIISSDSRSVVLVCTRPTCSAHDIRVRMARVRR